MLVKTKRKKSHLPRARHELAVFVKKKVTSVVNQNLKTKQKKHTYLARVTYKYLLLRTVKSLKAFKLNFADFAEKIPKQFLVLSSRRSEFKITCLLCSVLNPKLKKVHSYISSYKNLSYKKVIINVEINQNFKNIVRTILS